MKHIIISRLIQILPYLLSLILTFAVHLILQNIKYPILETLLLATVINYIINANAAQLFLHFLKICDTKNIPYYLRLYDIFKNKSYNAIWINVLFIVLFCLEDRLQPAILTLFDIDHVNSIFLFKTFALIGVYYTILTSVFEYLNFKITIKQSIKK